MANTANTASEYVEIRVSKSWLRLIKFVASVMPDGEMTVKFVNGQPIKPVKVPMPEIRFDKDSRTPQIFAFEFSAENVTSDATQAVPTTSRATSTSTSTSKQ